MSNTVKFCVVPFVLLLASAATAQESISRFELTPLLGYGTGGDFEDVATEAELEFDEAAAFGLIFNIRDTANTQWEVLYLLQSTELGTGGLFVNQPVLDIDVHYLHGGGTYILDDSPFQPYVAGTLGLTHFSPSSSGFDSESFFSFSLGAGLRFLPNERIGVRLEARWFATFIDSDTEVFCRTGGTNNVCAIRGAASLVNQWYALAGVTFRF